MQAIARAGDWIEKGLMIQDAHHMLQVEVALSFIQHIKPIAGIKLVDIGSGPGHHSFIFRALGADVVCCDYKAPLYEDLPWIAPDQLAQGEYDAVWSHHCLEHIPDPLGQLIAWNQALKPGGKLFLTVPEIGYVMSNGHINSFNLPLLMYLLAISGFSTRDKRFNKQDSHLRIVATKSLHYHPHAASYTTIMQDLSDYGLFPQSVASAIKAHGRFSIEDIHMDWFGTCSAPRKGSVKTYEYFSSSTHINR